MKNRVVAFPYFGGKASKLSWLLPKLPYDTVYCEPYGGSAAVLLNRDVSDVEVFNDLNDDVVHFFRTLRKHSDKLIEQLSLTPYSRQELVNSAQEINEDVERARRFFVRIRQSYLAIPDGVTKGRWAQARTRTRRELPVVVSRWLGGIEGLEDVVMRLRGVMIENDDALKVIERYDSPETVFYLDPPYVMDTRPAGKAYRFEYTDQDHRELAEILNSIEGRAAISGYESPLYLSLYDGWHINKGAEKCIAGQRKDRDSSYRQEILWSNYDPLSVREKDQTPLTEFIE